MNEPLTIKFTRTGGGLPHLESVVRDAVLSADDEHAWLGTERPLASRRHAHDEHAPIRYRLEFRRGSERRVVELRDADRNAQLAPLIDEMVRVAEGR